MTFDERRAWCFKNINQEATTTNHNMRTRKRKHARKYMFTVNNTAIQVCALFWRHTLGYQHDKFVTKVFEASENNCNRVPKDKRGKHIPKHALTDDVKQAIYAHVESFNPYAAHCRRADAPLWRYLPPKLSPRILFQYFKELHPTTKLSEISYRRYLKKQNISFAKKGTKDCEVCQEWNSHECQGSFNNTENSLNESSLETVESIIIGVCDLCDKWIAHIKK